MKDALGRANDGAAGDGCGAFMERLPPGSVAGHSWIAILPIIHGLYGTDPAIEYAQQRLHGFVRLDRLLGRTLTRRVEAPAAFAGGFLVGLAEHDVHAYFATHVLRHQVLHRCAAIVPQQEVVLFGHHQFPPIVCV